PSIRAITSQFLHLHVAILESGMEDSEYESLFVTIAVNLMLPVDWTFPVLITLKSIEYTIGEYI
ncbi:hypothetical protein PMAYCL1PPCAC_12311, partial [Pristionchus mayeri]